MRWKLTNDAPKCPGVLPSVESASPSRKDQVIENIRLVTPMLGGGVESLRIDNDMPIRAASIRGHLRFWWRMFQECASVQELWEKEKAVWGSTENASEVMVRVETTNPGESVEYRKGTAQNNTELPKYVIFPLDNTRDENGKYVQSFTLKKHISFNLHLAYPIDKEEEVFYAVKLWLLFGGLGARTRRGMGSLYCREWTGWQSRKDVVHWLQDIIPAANISRRPEWPSLIGGKMQLVEEVQCQNRIVAIWSRCIEKYQKFRQFRIDRNTGEESAFGHSVWPEPNALRTLNRNGHFGQDAYFPRGAFGLPILFYFGKNNPINATLDGFADGIVDRWSSPMILKVARISEHTCLKICLKLNSPMPECWCLKLMEGTEEKLIPPSAYPMANHPAKQGAPLKGDDPYTALFKAMGPESNVITLGKGGKV